MKKIYLIVLSFFIIIMPTIVNADSSVIVSCSSSNNIAGEALNCSILATVDDGVTYDKVTANISGASILEFSRVGGFTGSINNGKLLVTADEQSTNGVLGNLRVEFSRDTSGIRGISLSNIRFYSEGKEVATANNVTTNIEVKSSVDTLKSLNVSDCNDCEMLPKFSEDTMYYTVSTDSDSINIEAIANGNAIVTGAGVKNLTKDKETFEVTVNSESGSLNRYRIIVSKKGRVSSDNALSLLAVEGENLSPEFSSVINEYSLSTDKDTISIKAVANDNNATISGNGEVKLAYGKNEVKIVVTAEDGSDRIYTINVDRLDNRSSNNNLRKLVINRSILNLEENVLEYEYNVNASVKKLNIEATAEDKMAKINIIGNDDFQSGENVVTIEVTAENGKAKNYTLKVVKDEVDTLVGLDDLKISGYSIDFQKDNFDYDLTINDEDKLNINVTIDDNYSYEIIGNDNLQNGSIVKIAVSYNGRVESIYKITITKTTVLANGTDISDIDDINYIPYIMVSLLIILFIVDVIQLSKMIKRRHK